MNFTLGRLESTQAQRESLQDELTFAQEEFEKARDTMNRREALIPEAIADHREEREDLERELEGFPAANPSAQEAAADKIQALDTEFSQKVDKLDRDLTRSRGIHKEKKHSRDHLKKHVGALYDRVFTILGDLKDGPGLFEGAWGAHEANLEIPIADLVGDSVAKGFTDAGITKVGQAVNLITSNKIRDMLDGGELVIDDWDDLWEGMGQLALRTRDKALTSALLGAGKQPKKKKASKKKTTTRIGRVRAKAREEVLAVAKRNAGTSKKKTARKKTSKKKMATKQRGFQKNKKGGK